MRKLTICRSCDGVSENSLLGRLLVEEHGTELVALGVVHRPDCPELEDDPEDEPEDSQ